MHNSAKENGRLFFNTYNNSNNTVIIDVGSQDFNNGADSLRSVVPKNAKYIGMDLESGPNVDLVMPNPYTFPLADNSVDMIVSSSCFEHSMFFWLTFNEMIRVLKPNGLAYINAPSNGPFHRFPVDCYRFYPDAGFALQNWARYSGYHSVTLIESYTSLQDGDMWNDFVAIFIKDSQFLNTYSNRILYQIKNYTNGVIFNHSEFLNQSYWPEDFAKTHPDILQNMYNGQQFTK